MINGNCRHLIKQQQHEPVCSTAEKQENRTAHSYILIDWIFGYASKDMLQIQKTRDELRYCRKVRSSFSNSRTCAKCHGHHLIWQSCWVQGQVDFCFYFWWLTPLSAIFQLYHGDKFQWWKKPEYPERTTDHGQATGKLYHLRLRVECTFFVFYKAGR